VKEERNIIVLIGRGTGAAAGDVNGCWDGEVGGDGVG